jgi:aerobic C4-dicarboxylate transport protein
MASTVDAEVKAPKKSRWYRQLYFWVIVAIIAGILVGWLWPSVGTAMQPIGTTFVEAMRMLIGPIVFLTIIGGIASVANLSAVGKTGIKALVYFQVGTLVALATGLLAINLIPLGEGVNANVDAIETNETVDSLISQGEKQQWWEFLTHIVPSSVVEPFVEGDILQIIFLAVIFGVALNAVGRIGAPILDLVQRATKVIFKVLSYIMKLAPLGAFGAMAFAIGKYGISTLTSLGSLILLFYATSAFFILVVLGSVMGYLKLNILKLIRYLKEEILLVIGTSTAEPALPGLMRKMEYAGVRKSTVGLVVPTGYSFNLDGAAIYLSLAAVYLAQATGANLSIGQQIGLMAVMLLTSKGAAGVAGGGFIALAATLSTVGTIPAAAIMLIFGIDKFMSECRALTNFVGNAVATLFVGKWDKALDYDRARKVLNKEPVPELPAEIDATENPLSIESTKLVGAYTADFHHHPHPPQPEYSVEAVAQELAQAKSAPTSPGTTDGATQPGNGNSANERHLIKP